LRAGLGNTGEGLRFAKDYAYIMMGRKTQENCLSFMRYLENELKMALSAGGNA
jgi:hypothetical protein